MSSFSSNEAVNSGSAQAVPTSTRHGSSISGLVQNLATRYSKGPDKLGENGDPCHSNLGYYSDNAKQLVSDTLALKQELVGNDQQRISYVVGSHWPKVTNLLSSLPDYARKTQIALLFKLSFFSRAIRCQGGRSRTQFFELFKRLRQDFPEESMAVLSLIPFYGCFQDIDQMITHYMSVNDQKIVNGLISVYTEALVDDFNKVFGTDVRTMTTVTLDNESHRINAMLKKLSTDELKEYCTENNISNLSFAGKWMKREGKKNSRHRDQIIVSIFPQFAVGSNSTSRGKKIMRKLCCILTQLLNVVEHNMTNATSRGWDSIVPKNVPSGATTKYRLAFINQTKTGGTRSTDQSRVVCAQNFLKSILEGKVNGAQCDLKKLSDLIWQKLGGEYGHSTRMTPIERQLINAQWKKMVEFVNDLIEEAIEKNRQEREEAIKAGSVVPELMSDPRAVMPVVDVSGSMSSAQVMHYAIAMGIVCASLSTIRGKLITFSENPEVFSFNPDADIFDVFRQIQRCKWGMSTNLDATYKLLLGEMKSARSRGESISTDFRLMIVTDGQFNSMVSYGGQPTTDRWGYSRATIGSLSDFDTFQKRQEAAFTSAGFGVPLVIYWNMANRSVGFPVQSDTVGVKLVAGFSQTVMVEVMTGDYSTVVDEETGAVKVGVTPLESFIKTMNDESFDPIVQALDAHWSQPSQPVVESKSEDRAVDEEIAALKAKIAMLEASRSK